jgi:hypothetical protein
MPNPTAGDVHVNVPLTNISVAWIQKQQAFIANRVFPNVPVAQQSNRYYTYQRDDFFRSEAQLRAPGTESSGSGFRIDNTPTYFCDVFAVHKDIDDQIRSNADSVISMDRDATLWVTQQLLIKRDKLWASNYFTTSVWTGGNGADLTGVTGAPGANQFKQWDAAGSSPIEDIRKQRILMAEKTGYLPGVLVLGAHVWRVLQDHAEFLDRIKYTERGMVTPDLLAAVLELDRVVVAYGVEATNIEGAAGAYSFIMGKHALLAYSPPAPSLMTPAAGYVFSWTGYLGAGPEGNRIAQFRMDPLKSDRVEGEMAFDMKVVSAELGQFFATAVA